MPIVVGYRDNPEGRAAISRAVEEATLRGQSLVVLHTEHEESGEDHGATDAEVVALRARLDETGLEYEVRTEGRDRDVAGALIDLAVERDAALVVIGIRKRSLVGKFLLGSTAQRVLLDAPMPVLAVKSDERD
ncbi:universal stress protein [Actinoalloteichus sp. AHMU CJ021]|uniref:Universal stress protein family protein n=1 Tax=Actinoalloteichus caeruleus DSM 43889 TaxID=1120930 RepID=A0ABT1JFV1_ACTCY|nr:MULTISPECIES: universal stress protein [Actinoalloteichus]AUS77341.1 universal stress protein [Actinoalloteichus sp. AHMU CJ021]MCP2331159.1 Universal stress protein family protein [Actinoalloteichus caeruleus DSM 43889]